MSPSLNRYPASPRQSGCQDPYHFDEIDCRAGHNLLAEDLLAGDFPEVLNRFARRLLYPNVHNTRSIPEWDLAVGRVPRAAVRKDRLWGHKAVVRRHCECGTTKPGGSPSPPLASWPSPPAFPRVSTSSASRCTSPRLWRDTVAPDHNRRSAGGAWRGRRGSARAGRARRALPPALELPGRSVITAVVRVVGFRILAMLQ